MTPDEALQQAVAMHRAGRFAEAEQFYRVVLAAQPGHADLLHNRGVCLQNLGRLDEALASYDAALAVRPDSVASLCNRGAVLKDLRQSDAALVCFERVLALQPAFLPAINNRAAALLALGRYAESLRDSERVLQHHPDLVEALNNRGVAMKQLDHPEAALASFNAALALRADDVVALENRGALLADLGQHAAAVQDFAQALRLAPLTPYVRGALLHARMHCCDWHALDEDLAAMQRGVNAGERCAEPFVAIASIDAPALHRTCATTWMRDRCPPTTQPLWRGERYRHERIRVAYVSGDFRDHPLSQLMVELFERHDRARFEVLGVSFGPNAPSGLRSRVQRAFEHFVDVRDRTDAEIAALLRAREIDIAVDLQGFTHRARSSIFARRAVPVQVSYLGYPGTLGAPWMDYVVADAHVIPEGREHLFAEQVVRMPWSYLVNDGQRAIANAAPTRAAAGLPAIGFVFCSFNSSYKITPTIFDIWMRLLAAVEGSVLWLLQSTPAAVANLRQEAFRRGVNAERLVFAPRLPVADHLARHRLADLFLDTLPYNAHTTASDALWTGLPVVTCPGEAFAARVAASLLHAIGLPELVAATLADYEARALQLARTPDALNAVKMKLAVNRNAWPLFDSLRFARDIESAYQLMWDRVQLGQPPVGFAVTRPEQESFA
ncbi:MAG: tetratricopeptide repeat protein [Betaproteobacteria bacterium]